MSNYYLDTSALIKRYRTERGTELVEALFTNQTPAEVLAVSQLTALEVEVVAARAFKGKLITETTYRGLLWALAEDLENRFVVLPVSSSLVVKATQIVRRHRLKAADAIHLATALQIQQSPSGAPVIIASDHELLAAAESSGLSILNPEAPDAIGRLKQLRN